MKLKVIQPFPDWFVFRPDDKEQPKVGAVFEHKNEAVCNLLTNRGWCEEVKDPPKPAKPAPKGEE